MRETTNNNDSAEDALRTVLDILTIMTARNHLARINDPVQSSVEITILEIKNHMITPVCCLNVSTNKSFVVFFLLKCPLMP